MARRAVPSRPDANPVSWWRSIPEKVGLAAATALGTALVTLAAPEVKERFWKEANATGVSEKSVGFQRAMWKANANCAGDPNPMWHNSEHGRKIDVTVCPGTGDLLIQMRNHVGKQLQWFADLSELKNQFEERDIRTALTPFDLFGGRAWASGRQATSHASPSETRLAQHVICQIFLPDGRGLRRRIMVGPNQCVEIIIDTFTGQIVSQRPIPCVPNCAVNV